MSSEDNRIVNMKFNNAQFEQGISESLNSLNRLENKLQFKHVGGGILNKLSSAFGSMAGAVGNVGAAADEVSVRFDAMNVMGMTVIQNLTNKVTDFATTLAKNMTIQPMMDGFNEYEEKIDAIQTIMSNTKWKYGDDTATQLGDVNGALDELNTYADKTIYNFTDMTRAIGQFTTAGMDVKESTTAIKGLSNLAAYEGVNNESLARAEYQLSQMLQTGSMKLMDWNSVVNAGMGGKVFQDQLIQAAQEIGQEVPEAVLNGEQSFRDSLSGKGDSWVTKDVVEQAMANMADNEDMEAAATKIRTFSKLVSTLREEIGSDWTNTWEEIVGDYGQATDLYTMINDRLGGLISESGKLRVEFIHNLMNMTDPDSGNFATGREMLVNVIDNLIGDIEYLTKAIKNGAEEVFGVIKPEQVYSYLIAASYYTDEFRKKVDQVSSVIVNVTKVAFGLLKIGISGIKTLIGAAQPLFNATKRLGSQIFDLVASFGEWLNSDEVAEARTRALAKIAEWAGHIFEIFGKAVDGVGKTLKEFTDSSGFAYILDGLEHLASAAGKIVTAIVDAADQVFTHINGKTLSGYAKGFDDVAINIDNVASKIQGSLTKVFTVIFKAIDLVVKVIGQFIKVLKPVAIAVTNVIGVIIQGIGKLIDGVTTGAISIKKIIGKLGSLFGLIKDFVTGPLLDKLSGAIDKIFGDGVTEKLVNGLKDKISELPGVFDKVKESLKKLPDAFDNAKNSAKKFADVASGAIDKVFGEGTTKKIADTTKSTGSKVKNWFEKMTAHAKSFIADPSFEKVYNVFDTLNGKIGDAVTAILKHFMSLEDATTIGDAVQDSLDKAVKKILKISKDFKDDVPAMFKKTFVKIGDYAKDFAKDAPATFQKGLNSIGKVSNSFFKSLPSKFMKMFDDIKQHFKSFKKDGTSSASSFFATVGNIISDFKKEGASSVSSFFSSIKNVFSDFKSDIPSDLSGLAEKVKSIITKLFSEIKDMFGGKKESAGVFASLGDSIAKPFKDGSLLKTIKGFFENVGKNGKSHLQAGIKIIKDKLPELASAIFTKLGNAFVLLFEAVKKLWERAKPKLVSGLEDFGSKIKNLFSKKNIKAQANIPVGANYNTEGLDKLSEQMTTISDKSTSFSDAASEIVDHIIDIGKAYGGLFKIISAGVVTVLVIKQINKLIGSLKSLIPISGTVKSAISSFTAPLTQISKNIKALRIIEFATAISIFANSLVKVGQLDAGALIRATIAISLLVGEMVLVMKQMDKLGSAAKKAKSIKSIVTGIKDDPSIKNADTKRIMAIGVSLIGFAAAIRILSDALNKIAQVPVERVGDSMLALSVLIGELTAVGVILSKASSKYGSFIKSAASLVIFTVAISKVVKSVQKLAAIGDTDVLVFSVAAVALLMAELAEIGTVLAKSQKANGSFASTAGSMLVFALALIPVMRAVQVIGKMPLQQMMQGVTVVAGIMAGLAAIAALLTGKSFKKASAVLEEVSGTKKGFKYEKLIAMSAALISFSIALNTVTKSMQKLGAMDFTSFLQGLAGFAVISGVMVASIKQISAEANDGLKPAASAMLKFGSSIGLLTLSVRALAAIPLASLIQGLVGMGAEILIVYGAIRLLGNSEKQATTAAMSILKLAGALTVFGLAISAVSVILSLLVVTMSAIPITTILEGLANIILVVGTMTLTMIALTKALQMFGGGIPTVVAALGAFLAFTVDIVALSIAMNALGISAMLLANVPWEGIAKLLVLVAASFAVFAGIAIIAQTCGAGLAALGAVMKPFGDILQGIGKIIEAVSIGMAIGLAAILATVVLGKDKISAALDDAIALMPKFAQLLSAAIQAIIDGVIAKVPDVANAIVTGLLQILIDIDSHTNQFLAVIDDILAKIATHLGEQISILFDNIMAGITKGIGWLLGKIPVIGDGLESKFDGYSDWWAERANKHAKDMATTAGNAFGNGLLGIEPSVFSSAAGVTQAAADGMESVDTTESANKTSTNILTTLMGSLNAGSGDIGSGAMANILGSMMANSDATPVGDNTATTYSNGYSSLLGLTDETNGQLVEQMQQLGIDTSAITDQNGMNIMSLFGLYGGEANANVQATDDAIAGDVTGTGDEIGSDVSATGDEISSDVSETGDEVVSAANDASDGASDAVQNGMDESVNAVDGADGAIRDASSENGDAWVEPIEEAGDTVQNATDDALNGAVGTISDKDGEFYSGGTDNADEYTSGLSTAQSGSESAGDNASQGFLNSAGSYGGSFWSKGWDLAKNFLGGLFGGLDEHSPSKKTAWAADMAILGFTNTIHDGLKDVAISGTTQGGAYTEALQEALQQADDLADGMLEYSPTITPVVDLSQVRAGMRTIDSMTSTSSSIAATISSQNGSSSAQKMTDSLNSVASSLGSIQGGNNNVYITVNAAEGQSANDVANLVMDKINTQMRRRKAAY